MGMSEYSGLEMLVTRSLCKMMEKLGVSDSNSYLWNTPIWGHQFGELPFIQPPPPPPPTPQSAPPPSSTKMEIDEELHDCEAEGEGKGKRGGKRGGGKGKGNKSGNNLGNNSGYNSGNNSG